MLNLHATGSVPARLLGGLGRVAIITGAAAAFYNGVFKPWQHRWGASADEVEMEMPGDEIVPNPNYNTTRAITINAPPEDVWPWLAQMGQGRGGLYSYDWLENLAGLDIHSVDWIVPEWQDLKEGDLVPLAPDGFGLKVSAIEPNSSLLLTGQNEGIDVTWAWKLIELEGYRTRLIARWRARFSFDQALNEETKEEFKKSPWRTFSMLVISFFLDPGEFIMQRAMLLGIKRRAENLALT